MQDTSDARVPPYNRCDRNILFDVRNILFDDRNNCLMIAMVITVLTGNLLRISFALHGELGRISGGLVMKQHKTIKITTFSEGLCYGPESTSTPPRPHPSL